VDDAWVFRSDLAVPHLHRAIAADSDYTGAKAQLAYALATLGRCGEVDSLSDAMDLPVGQVTLAERGMFAYSRAACRHDRPAQLEAAKAVLRATPRSIGFSVLGGIDAIELGRPREGLEILQRLDAEHIQLSPQQADVYWDFISYAKHDLAMIQQDSNGGRIPKGSPLAALADSDAVRRQVERQLPHPGSPELAETQCAVMELRAHGSPTAAAALLERIAAARGPDAAADVLNTPCYWNLFSVHYYAGRLTEARAAYRKVVAADSSDVKAHAALAAIAVRRGDSTDLKVQRRWLLGHDNPVAFLGLAHIAVLQGKQAEAVSFLREALDRDLERHFLHLDPDLEPLRDYPPFRELMRFKE
jgi:tetratricopeptide (TPR) repeat protein